MILEYQICKNYYHGRNDSASHYKSLTHGIFFRKQICSYFLKFILNSGKLVIWEVILIKARNMMDQVAQNSRKDFCSE